MKYTALTLGMNPRAYENYGASKNCQQHSNYGTDSFTKAKKAIRKNVKEELKRTARDY